MTSTRRRIGATYRLQLAGLRCTDVAAIVPYLATLGIETLYLSPVSRARTGSAHGYDVVDPNELDPAFGTTADFDALLSTVEEADMNVLLDIVPNHMAASDENAMWNEVLESGQEGTRGGYFDIDWEAGDGRVLLPVLGQPLADVIAGGELGLALHDGVAVLTYGERFFPLAHAGSERHGASAAQLDVPGLLEDQHYRLAYWRCAPDELNYRRFFDINDLVGVRLEDAAVYADSHRLILELARDDRIAGLRIDHVDGLADPADYLGRLCGDLQRDGARPVVLVEKILAQGEEIEADWDVDGATGYEFAALVGGLFIDAPGAEAIAGDIASLTGDDRSFAERVVGAKLDVLERLFPAQLDRVARSCAQAVASDRAASDLSLRAVRRAAAALIANLGVYRTYGAPGRPLSPAGIEWLKLAVTSAEANLDAEGRRALAAIASLYLDPARLQVACSGDDTAAAVAGFQQLAGAVMAKGGEDTAAYSPGRSLAGVDVGTDPDEPALSVGSFHEAMAERFVRTPSALNATSTHDSKRSEDVRCRLAVLSEMPAGWLSAIETFRTVNAPYRTLLDGFDVPDPAEEIYLYETLVGTYPLTQGASTDYVARIQQHMEKVLREAKRHSSWTEPSVQYEAAVKEFVSSVLAPGNAAFLGLLDGVTADIGPAGAANSLAQTLLRVTAPGVPDTYQGTERWALTLVDPDNRFPVDFSKAAGILDGLDSESESAPSLLSNWQNGRVKLAVLARALRLRRRHHRTFDEGAYVPLSATGTGAEHVVAFARVGTEHLAMTAVVRHNRTLAGAGAFAIGASFADGAVVLPGRIDGTLTDVLTGRDLDGTGGSIPLSELFAELPVALLSTVTTPS